MRIVVVLIVFGACALNGPYATVAPNDKEDGPLGVGLTRTYLVRDYRCLPDQSTDGFYDDCEPATPSSIDVEIDGSTLKLGHVEQTAGTFDLVGVAAGTSTITVTTGDDNTVSLTVNVETVGSTSLFAPRKIADTTSFSNVVSPVHAFVGSFVEIDQINLGPQGDARAGTAPLAIAAGPTQVHLDPDLHAFATGTTPGQAQLSTPLATLTMDVVDQTALQDFTIGESTDTTLTLSRSAGVSELALLGTNGGGEPIVGLGGPTPTVTIADPPIVKLVGRTLTGDVPAVEMRLLATGTTTMDVTWGGVHKTFTVVVVP